MIFKYTVNNYSAQIKRNELSISAICDTGASRSSMDLYALSALTGYKAQEIYDYIIIRVNKGLKVYYAHTASGRTDRVVNIALNNIEISGKKFQEFYFRLNIDNESWKTAGLVEIDNKKIQIQPIVLIGLDLIRCGEIIGNKDIIKIDNFKEEDYLNNSINKFQNEIIKLYANSDIEFTDQDYLAAEVRLKLKNIK